MVVKNIISITLFVYSLNNAKLSYAGSKLIGPLLLKLEKDINKMILNPEPAHSDKLILDLLYYCRTLIRLSYMVDDREEAAKEVAQYLFKEGGPAFLQAQIDNTHLMNCLNWNKEDVKNLYFLIEKVKLLWVEFHKTYKRNIVCFISCKVSKDVFELPAVDEFIVLNLRESPQNRADILEAVEHYRAVLYKVYQAVLHHDRWHIDDATYLYRVGKPKFLNEPIDIKALSKLFEWNQGHFTGLYLLKLEVEQFWNDFTRQYDLVKHLYIL